MVYAVGVSLFVLVVSVLDILDIRYSEITTAQLSAIGVSLVGPLIPFVHKISLPGGAGFSWTESDSQRVNESFATGLPEFQERLDELDLDEVLTGVPAESRDD